MNLTQADGTDPYISPGFYDLSPETNKSTALADFTTPQFRFVGFIDGNSTGLHKGDCSPGLTGIGNVYTGKYAATEFSVDSAGYLILVLEGQKGGASEETYSGTVSVVWET
jgi:hypothetical protein